MNTHQALSSWVPSLALDPLTGRLTLQRESLHKLLSTTHRHTHTHTLRPFTEHTVERESKTSEACSWWTAGQHLFTVKDAASYFHDHQSSLARMKIHISAFEVQGTHRENHGSKQSSVSLNILKLELLALCRRGKSFEHIDLSTGLPRGRADCQPFQPDNKALIQTGVEQTWLWHGCQVS